MQLPWLVKYQYAATLLVTIALTKVTCFHFNFPTFQPQDESNLLLHKNAKIYLDAIQVTPDIRGPIHNYSGRAFYRKPYQLWKQKKNQNQIASFNTTFVLNITPQTTPGGEGVAFILTSDTTLPENSDGEWLGIVNATSNGTSQAGILAVEFDTRHSFTEDGPDNHVGVNINSINSIQQVSLINARVNLSSGQDVKFHIQFFNGIISVFGSMNGTSEDSMETLLVTPPLNVSSFLQQEVYLGFSASTSNYTQLNCVRSWEFSGDDIRDNDKSLLWVYVTVPTAIVFIIIGGLVIFFLRRKKSGHMEGPEDAYPRIEDQIQYSSMAPKKFRLKEITKATAGFSPQNKLGQGGFGTVYKGLLENKEVAVKRISKNSRQGKQEFVAEVTTIGSLHHRNLVKLTGWCYENRELLLVYEFMPNGSLDKYLFGEIFFDDYKNSIVYWVWDLHGKGKVAGAVDGRLKKEEIKEEEVECVLVLGLACCHPNPHQRPSMRSVLQVLNGEAAPPEVAKERPAFMWPAMPPSFKEAEDSSLIQGTLTPFTEITGR
ncbi:hypothetical protein ACSQ67_015789 [Phaseolus vulgaris]